MTAYIEDTWWAVRARELSERFTPGNFDYHRVIVGYHGCDRAVANEVLLKQAHLKSSDNPWDWLGRGVYFWEFGPHRALEFAREQVKRGRVTDPCVIGAYIHLGRCFDLTDTEHTSQLSEGYEDWQRHFLQMNKRLPENKAGRGGGSDLLLRNRDCALINWYMDLMDTDSNGSYNYQTVRGVFVEGDPAYEGAGIYTKTHIQVAVRDPGCILGYFLPTAFFST